MATAQPIKILLVEDDEVPREIASKMLRLCLDAEVISTDTGEEAVKLFHEHHPALIIQDLRLNGALDNLPRQTAQPLHGGGAPPQGLLLHRSALPLPHALPAAQQDGRWPRRHEVL